MAVKRVPICVKKELLRKIEFIANCEGRTINDQLLVLICERIKKFEEENGIIEIE